MPEESIQAATYGAVVYASRRPAPQDLTHSQANRTLSAVLEWKLTFELPTGAGQRIGYGSRKC